MNPEIKDAGDSLHISIVVPKTMRGTYTYDEEAEWEQPAVCVYINERTQEFGLYHTQYLDYKDSLQATSPICFFYTKKEAEEIAERFDLPVEYSNYD